MRPSAEGEEGDEVQLPDEALEVDREQCDFGGEAAVLLVASSPFGHRVARWILGSDCSRILLPLAVDTGAPEIHRRWLKRRCFQVNAVWMWEGVERRPVEAGENPDRP